MVHPHFGAHCFPLPCLPPYAQTLCFRQHRNPLSQRTRKDTPPFTPWRSHLASAPEGGDLSPVCWKNPRECQKRISISRDKSVTS